PLETTAELAAVVRAAMPGGQAARNTATRVFQAIRIHLNDELNELARGLDAAFDALGAGGRLVTITFHSLEHRLVRQRFRQWVRGPDLPRRLPVRGLAAGRARPVAGVGNGQRPSPEEIEANPRARSAFLQAVEKEPSAGEREGRAPSMKQAQVLLPGGRRRLAAGRIRAANSRGDREAVASRMQTSPAAGAGLR
ncbi:MAG: 16S rRNA (cytosine(1402)-N(4))-methyltransferase, partial [Gammaproteobacteria bacterium]|nr:16S rRNA (cytosine(1402)-N(4))-methyltransferase [Gammaproteobacteria bacterium]